MALPEQICSPWSSGMMSQYTVQYFYCTQQAHKIYSFSSGFQLGYLKEQKQKLIYLVPGVILIFFFIKALLTEI